MLSTRKVSVQMFLNVAILFNFHGSRELQPIKVPYHMLELVYSQERKEGKKIIDI